MRRFYSVTFIICFFCVLSISGEIQRAPINKLFEDYISQDSGSTLHKMYSAQEFPTGYIPAPIDPTIKTFLPESKRMFVPLFLPYSYDLRALNRVTSVKNQNPYGTCWAFASFASLESALLIAETNDFSENNLVNLHGFDWGFNSGGNSYMAIAYMTRLDGPINEADDPYPNPGGSSLLPPVKHLREALFIPDKPSATNLDVIKQAIMDYGACFSCIRYEDGSYHSGYYSFYNSSSLSPNHAITLVGWDDTFPSNNFRTAAPANGAFLVKNSWGTGWGSGGYFWVSYYDYWIGKENCIFNDARLTNDFFLVYQHDRLGLCSSYGYGSTSAWGACIFDAGNTSIVLKAIGYYTLVADTICTIKIYTNTVSGSPVSGYLAKTFTNIHQFGGFHTAELALPSSITSRFAVVIKFQTPSYNYPIPAEEVIAGYSSAATFAPGQSFMSLNGSSWQDTYSYSFDVCIKAYAVPFVPSPPVPPHYWRRPFFTGK